MSDESNTTVVVAPEVDATVTVANTPASSSAPAAPSPTSNVYTEVSNTSNVAIDYTTSVLAAPTEKRILPKKETFPWPALFFIFFVFCLGFGAGKYLERSLTPDEPKKVTNASTCFAEQFLWKQFMNKNQPVAKKEFKREKEGPWSDEDIIQWNKLHNPDYR